jgi:hypothetical protein
MVTHFDATLGMGGWLDLTQQGLSPCKKYKTSWRSSAKSYRIIDLTHLPYLSNLGDLQGQASQLHIFINLHTRFNYEVIFLISSA